MKVTSIGSFYAATPPELASKAIFFLISKHLVLRIDPKMASGASEKTKLVKDTVGSAAGAQAPHSQPLGGWKMLLLALLLVLVAILFGSPLSEHDSKATDAQILEAPFEQDDMPPDGTVLLEGFDSLAETNGANSLKWYCAPDSWTVSKDSREGRGGAWDLLADSPSLRVTPPAKKDFWRKTFYDPILLKDDGPVAYMELNTTQWYTLTTSFTLTAVSQFDQAGLYLRLDAEHWIKTGIEVVDQEPRLSAVVTNVYSDWSTQPWSDYSTTTTGNNETAVVVQCQLRLHVRGSNVVVEAKQHGGQKSEWQFIRIAHLNTGIVYPGDPIKPTKGAFKGPTPPRGKLWAGVFSACPVDQQGTFADFHDLQVMAGSSFDHNADDIEE